MKKIWKKLGTLCLIFGLFFVMFSTCNAEETSEIIASGSECHDDGSGDFSWTIDKNGHLTVEGTGNVWEYWGIPVDWKPPWSVYVNRIFSAEINLTGTTDAYGMLYGCTDLKEVDLTNFDTSQLKRIDKMFYECRSLEYIEWGDFDTSQVTSMEAMFYNCQSLKTLDLSHFNTENMTSMSAAFAYCVNLVQLDLSSFETGKVRTMNEMFMDCDGLEELDLSNFDTKNVTYMTDIFAGCSNLKSLNISSFDIGALGKESNRNDLFSYCNNLREINLPKNCKLEIELPLKENCQWRSSDGTVLYFLPLNLTESITVRRITTLPVEKVFSDVYDDWYVEYLQYVFGENLMRGIEGTTEFRPNRNITKAQVAQVLYNMNGKPDVTYHKVFAALNDVYPQEWYADAVSWAYNAGVITGDLTTRKFSPNASVTREQMALMFYRYAAYMQYPVHASSTMIGLSNVEKISGWAEQSVRWAVGARLISGVEIKYNGKVVGKDLAPQGTATRAQMAAILKRFCEYYGYLLRDDCKPAVNVVDIPENAFEWNGHFYALFDNCHSWEFASAYCESKGGHLAVIDSAEENQVLYNFIKENGYTSAYFGLSDWEEEGTWRWMTGEEASYTNWNTDEPGGGTDENYAMFFYLYEDGTWNDGAFKENVHDGGNAYICEWE